MTTVWSLDPSSMTCTSISSTLPKTRGILLMVFPIFASSLKAGRLTMSRIGSLYDLKLLDFFEVFIRKVEYQKANTHHAESSNHLVPDKNIHIYSVQYMPDAAPPEHQSDDDAQVFRQIRKREEMLHIYCVLSDLSSTSQNTPQACPLRHRGWPQSQSFVVEVLDLLMSSLGSTH